MEFKCTTKVIQFAGSPSNVYEINVVTGEVIFIKTLGITLNAIGYNPIDNYIYGSEIGGSGGIYRFDSDYNFIKLPTPVGYPLGGLNSGAFDTSGYYYLEDSVSDEYFVIDYNPARATYGKIVDPTNGYIEILSAPFFNIATFSSPPLIFGMADWAWHEPLGVLCGVSNSGNVRCLNPVTAIVTDIPTVGAISNNYGAASSFINGDLYFPTNTGKNVIKITTDGTTANAQVFSETNLTFALNDATSCVLAEVLVDFGDAPDISSGNGPGNYSTLLANNGPRHQIFNNIKLGSLITSESDAYQNPTAIGDDILKGTQDDSVSLPILELLKGQTTYTLPITYTNFSGNDANIYAWIDFNMDGIFQLNEKADILVVPSDSTNNPRTVNLNFTIPNGVQLNTGDLTFIRIRLTTENLINKNNNLTQEDTRSIGPAKDGEVEDYQIGILDLTIQGNVWYDINCNGLRDTSEPLLEGIKVELFSNTNLITPINFTTTDVNGFYQFKNLPEGKYYIKVTLPTGFNYTLTNVGSNDLIDSDINISNGYSELNYLNRLNPLIVVDSGLCKCSKISGQAFYDCNKNNELDYKDSYLCGVTIQLLNSNNEVIDSVITDCDGYYEFKCVDTGTYTVHAITPPDLTLATQNSSLQYGSKPDVAGNFIVNISTSDYVDGFIGFTGNKILDGKYCKNITCNSDLTTDCSSFSYPNTCTNCDGTCAGCTKNCKGKCLGCNTCRPSNRPSGESCSKCSTKNCNCCD